ncbi:hypothetical protein GOV09_00700 [Candidatus Woesearchaeota archaeon]|nr:hypothetical protein [Candidatus Woesearchaeota archaeon]
MVELSPIRDGLLQPLQELWAAVLNVSPGVIWFIIIVIVGYFIAAILGWIVKKILYRINIDKKLRKLDLHDSMGPMSIAKLTGMIFKWYVFILFLNQGVTFLQLGKISDVITTFVAWLPRLIIGIVIIIVGLIFIDFIVHKLLAIKNRYIKFVATTLKAILIVIVVFTAIEQFGIETRLAQNIFLMIVGAVLITFSLALGIGLGLSFKDELKPVIRKFKKRL